MSFDKFLQDGQDPKVIEKIHAKIVDMLSTDESLSYIALQKKPAVTLLPDSIAITNKRIFLCEFTKLGLSTNFEIFTWKDIKDIAFKEEIFGSKVTVIPFTGENLSIDYIPKSQARKLYQLIKEALANVNKTPETTISKPESIIEKPKPVVPIREIYEQPKEEAKPAVQVVVPPQEVQSTIVTAPIEKPVIEHRYDQPRPFQQSTPTPVPIQKEEEDDEITFKLKKLKTLYDRQLITQSEYENKKAEILSQL